MWLIFNEINVKPSYGIRDRFCTFARSNGGTKNE